MNYDVAIIGAGLSGLAAGIRLAHFGKKVVILEAHTVVGGLNSFYQRGRRTINVGLHAMTNFAEPGEAGLPLTKLLRQLRIPYDALGLIEQKGSRIVVPSCTLKFTNQFNYLRSQVAEKFPAQIDNFNRLADHIDEYDDVALEPASYSARQVVSEYLTDPLLTEMLFVPIMYYGNPTEYDMDFTHFAVMCKSIYQQGFSRPEAGMKPVLEMLRKRYEDAGGTLRLRTAVEELEVRNDKIRSIRLAGGEEITADKVFSSAGLVETMRLCSHMPDDCMEEKVGRISFVELIAVLDRPVPSLGIEDTIVFFDSDGPFTFCRPDDLTSLASGVICFSDNFLYKTPPKEGVVRITAKASYPQWRKIVGSDHPRKAPEEARAEYEARKKETVEKMLSEAIRYVPDFREHIVFTDLFTPLTITRFSRHLGGTVYGSPQKNRTGLTPVSNLFLCGTDQGFLGIVGAMLSGISMANLQCLQ